MSNKKSLLQDSLQELENIKNESLELAKEQLINESADLLEKKSAALFEKLISEEVGDFEDMPSDVETDEKPFEIDEPEEPEMSLDEMLEKLTEPKEKTLDEILAEIKNSEGMYDDDESEDDESEDDESEDDESEDDEEMSLEDLKDAAERMGLKLVKDTEEDEEELEDSEDDGEELEDDDIEFGDEESDDEDSDEDEFMDVEVDDKVLAENNNRFKNTKVMKNNRKEALKDLRDVSFNRLVEAYYNMNESDAFIVKDEGEDEMMDEMYDMDEPMDEMNYMDEMNDMDEMYNIDEMDNMDEEDTLYEVDFPESEPSSLTDEELNEMLADMDMEEGVDMERYQLRRAGKASGISSLNNRRDFRDDAEMRSPAERVERKERARGLEGGGIHEFMEEDMYGESKATDTRDKFVKQGLIGPIHGKAGVDESMFEDLTMEELEEIKEMLDGDGSYMESMSPEENVMSEEEEIEEMLYSMKEEEEMEESSAIPSQTKRSVGNRGGGSVQGRPERRSNMIAEDEMEEVQSLQEKIKKLEKEKATLQEGFVNKVKSLENKVYDVTISALKAGFVNKFLLEHPLRENEKLEIIHRFSNAQTKEQIKETYISLTNEFAKGQTVNDGSMLNESVQNKVGKVHRTDNAVVREKNLMNENDESNRFKQLLNYNFNKKK